MLPYFLLIIVLIFLFITDSFLSVRGKPLEVFAIILVICFAGLREYVGYDFYNYWEIYVSGNIDASVEPGFLLVMKILRAFNADYHVFFFAFSLIIYASIYKGIIKLTEHSHIAILTYLLIPGLFLNSLSVIRQAAALGVSFYAFTALADNKKTKYFLLMMAATSFHLTALFIIPFHLLSKRYAHSFKFRSYMFLIIGSFIFGQLNISKPFFELLRNFDRYEFYSYEMPMNFIKLLVLNVVTIFLLFFNGHLSQKKAENDYVMFLTICAMVITNMASSFEFITRFSYYLKVYEIIVVAEIISLFRKNTQLLLAPVVFSYYIFIFYASLANDASIEDTGTPMMTPYKSILNKEPLTQ